MDETGCFWKALPEKGFAEKGKVCKGGKKSKLRLTIAEQTATNNIWHFIWMDYRYKLTLCACLQAQTRDAPVSARVAVRGDRSSFCLTFYITSWHNHVMSPHKVVQRSSFFYSHHTTTLDAVCSSNDTTDAMTQLHGKSTWSATWPLIILQCELPTSSQSEMAAKIQYSGKDGAVSSLHFLIGVNSEFVLIVHSYSPVVDVWWNFSGLKGSPIG